MCVRRCKCMYKHVNKERVFKIGSCLRQVQGLIHLDTLVHCPLSTIFTLKKTIFHWPHLGRFSVPGSRSCWLRCLSLQSQAMALTSLIGLRRISWIRLKRTYIVYTWRGSLCRAGKTCSNILLDATKSTFEDPDLPVYLRCQDAQCQILRVGTRKNLIRHCWFIICSKTEISDDFMWFHKFRIWDFVGIAPSFELILDIVMLHQVALTKRKFETKKARKRTGC